MATVPMLVLATSMWVAQGVTAQPGAENCVESVDKQISTKDVLSKMSPACAGLLLNNLAAQKQITGQLVETERYAERALHALESAYPEDDPVLFRPLQILAAARFERGDIGKARQAFKRMQSLRIERATDRALLNGMSAALLTSEERYGEAELAYLTALREWDEAGRANSSDAAVTLTALGSLYTGLNRMDDAARVLEQALRIIDFSSDAVPAQRFLVLCTRGALYARRQQWRRAEQDLRDAISIAEGQPGLDPRVLSRVLRNYSYVLRKNLHKREAHLVEMRADALHADPIPVVDATELSAERNTRKR